jgi:hypothetical protein
MNSQNNKLSLKEANLSFVVKKTIADMAQDEVKQDRAERIEELVELFREIGAEKFEVKLPDGETVATISIPKPKPKLAIKENELMGWLEANGYEHLIQTVTIPERVEKKIPVDVLEKIGAIETEDGEYVTPDGVPVDGAYIAKPEPNSIRVTYAKGGQHRIIDAWHSGELASIDAGTTLPQIEGGN